MDRYDGVLIVRRLLGVLRRFGIGKGRCRMLIVYDVDACVDRWRERVQRDNAGK